MFIATPKVCTAEGAARLFLTHVVKHWGIPKDIVTDRDVKFTGKRLFELLGTRLQFPTSNHPQTDGQTERINALLEEDLRHYVMANQSNWVDLLDIAQFSYNIQKTSTTGLSPFEVATGRQPLTPQELAKQDG